MNDSPDNAARLAAIPEDSDATTSSNPAASTPPKKNWEPYPEGYCVRCRKKAQDGSRYCYDCALNAERRCTKCKKYPAGWYGNPRSPWCKVCADKSNAEQKANPITPSKKLLEEIRETKRIEKIERGEICYRCGRGTPDPGHEMCYGCEEQENELRSDIGKLDAAADAGTSSDTNGSEQLEFPEDCMYGEAKALAKQLRVPLGLGYPAVIGCWSVKPNHDQFCGTRINTMVALCAPVGGGKNVAMDRAQRLLGLTKDMEYKKAAPAGTRALMSLLGDKPSGKRGDKTRTPGPRKLLLITHEMTDVLKMTGVDNSTLASRLCDFWDDNEFEYPTKEGIISVDCRLSWVGGVPCSVDNPTRFTELFDAETSHGLYDRLILGYSDVKFNFRPWQPPASNAVTLTEDDDYTALVPREPRISGMSPEAEAIYEGWQPEGGGSRIKQNCMKVALITAMMNHEETVSEECMRCAIRFMEWQITLRRVFEPGEAINDSARCRTVILDAMERVGAKQRFINIKRLAHDRKWGKRFGDWLVKTTIKNLADMGEIVPDVEDECDKHGNPVSQKKSENMFKLRDFSKR